MPEELTLSISVALTSCCLHNQHTECRLGESNRSFAIRLTRASGRRLQFRDHLAIANNAEAVPVHGLYLMMPVKLSLSGCVLMQSRLADARRGLTFVILAMTTLPGSGIFTCDAPRSTSTTGFCTAVRTYDHNYNTPAWAVPPCM